MTDILDDAYESDLTDEEHEALILISEHAIAKPHPHFPMTDQHPITSPAAQAVLEAYRSTHLSINNLAAALRAAALYCKQDRIRLLAIADELEAQ